MPLPEKQSLKSTSEPIDACLGSLTEEQLLQLPSASVQADNQYLAAPGFKISAALPEVAGSATSLLSNSPADLEGGDLFAFYPSAGQTSNDQRPSLVDAVIEQLRHARLRRQRPH